MRQLSIPAISIFLIALVSSSSAFANADLAKAKNCLACHTVDKKLIGPPYKEVAAKYKGQKNAEVILAASIEKGSTGKWGPIPMPANQVSDADAKTLAKWILSQ